MKPAKSIPNQSGTYVMRLVAFLSVLMLVAAACSGTSSSDPVDIEWCESLARGVLPDGVDKDTPLQELIDEARERCGELNIELPAGKTEETNDTDGTLAALAQTYCDIRTELAPYLQSQPPPEVENRLEAESLQLFADLEAVGSGLQDPAFQAEAHLICPEWVPNPAP